MEPIKQLLFVPITALDVLRMSLAKEMQSATKKIH